MREYEDRQSERDEGVYNNHVRSSQSSKEAEMLTKNGSMKKDNLPTNVNLFITRNLSKRHF